MNLISKKRPMSWHILYLEQKTLISVYCSEYSLARVFDFNDLVQSE